MSQIGLSNYLSGIMNLASSLSTWIGPSFVEVECYEKENALTFFLKDYHIKNEDYKWEEYPIAMKQLLEEILGKEDKLIEGILYWMCLELGNITSIKIPNNRKIIDKLSRSDNGLSRFYTVENLYEIEFEKYIIYFMIGNNE